MTASVHFATGAASALFIQRYGSIKYGIYPRYAWGFVAGVMSHVVFDAIPHAEYSIVGKDLFLLLCLEAMLLMWVLIPNRNLVMSQLLAWGYVGGALPDVLGMAGRHLGWDTLIWLNEILHLSHGKVNLFFADYMIQLSIVVVCVIYVRIKSA